MPPSRVELFGFYYLGFNPEGKYKFPNVRHVAAYYRVGPDRVLDWLEELEIGPHEVLMRQYNLALAAVDLELESANLTPEGIRLRMAEILAELEGAKSGRKPWED